MPNFLSSKNEKFERYHVVKNTCECLNNKQRKSTCISCEQICPKHIMNHSVEFEPSFDECLDCNLCTVVCPIRAISFSSLNAKKIKHILDSKKQVVKIGCDKSDQNKDLELYCIASLPWETLVHIALNKTVVFDKSRCDECKSSHLLEIFNSNLKRAKQFLGDENFDNRIAMIDQTDNEQVSRRQMFLDIARIFRDDFSPSYPNKLSRKNMFKQLKFYAKNKEFGFKTLRINKDKCCACKICESVCPFGAISIDKNRNTFTLHHSVLRCNECGLCKTTCLFGAIEDFNMIYAKTSLTNYQSSSIKPNKCIVCGEFIPQGYIKCFECDSKERSVNLFS